jgi:hypothetical protein
MPLISSSMTHAAMMQTPSQSDTLVSLPREGEVARFRDTRRAHLHMVPLGRAWGSPEHVSNRILTWIARGQLVVQHSRDDLGLPGTRSSKHITLSPAARRPGGVTLGTTAIQVENYDLTFCGRYCTFSWGRARIAPIASDISMGRFM